MRKTEPKLLDEKGGVAAAYEDGKVAESYLKMRSAFSWQRLLHRRQVQFLNDAHRSRNPRNVLEVAPGPARLSAELEGVKSGVMIENSAEMLTIALSRLQALGKDSAWQVRQGDAFKLADSIGSETFEFAYTFRFLRHFRTAEREMLYASLRNALQVDGHLVFDVVGSKMTDWVNSTQPRAQDEIPIYDVTYTEESFCEEMNKNGFDVVELMPVLKHFRLQSTVSYKLDNILGPVSDALLAGIEVLPTSASLEWVALCRKR